MQRLSLDPSALKLHGYGGRKDEVYNFDDSKSKGSVSSYYFSSSSSSSATDYDDHDHKDLKPRRSSLQSPFSPAHQKSEKRVHLIPLLTILCFLILYLFSHAPSQSDLAQFNGFKRHSSHIDSVENGDVSGLIRTDALAIRSSIRNLQDAEKLPARSLPSRRRTSHRKIGNF